jgi:hypothetical protein
MTPVQVYHLEYETGDHYRCLLMSDLHWDNPKCDRVRLKKDLDYAKREGLDVFINGDLFCAMQGRYDGRRMKSDIREEHNTSTYLDDLVSTAVEWFEPYKDNICLVGYGNHETSILKNCETDILGRWVEGMNARGAEIVLGGYGGWVVWSFFQEHGNGMAYKMKYFHGSGGGGPVTKGAIQFQRMSAMVSNADCIWQGHVHESMTNIHVVEHLNGKHTQELKEVLHVRTPTYKEEYADGTKGWHIMRGAPPKPLGCYVLDLELRSKKVRARALPL